MSRTRIKETAKYPLKDVVRLLPHARVSQGKAKDLVKLQVAQSRGRQLSDNEAHSYVVTLIQTLTSDAFVRRHPLTWHGDGDVVADVYGVRNKDGDWYIKFYIDEDTLLIVVSCHEPQGTMYRTDGEKIGRPRK